MLFLIYVQWGVFALVHLACLVAAAALLFKVKGTPAILATVAFALLFLSDVGWILRVAFLDRTIRNLVNFGPWALNSCCCGLFQLAAFVCLVVALWQALSEENA
jgi:hypothetical protein